ncbi:MAG: GNAT family N-acetyltransferase [Thermodesulfobacteriota bacterium]
MAEGGVNRSGRPAGLSIREVLGGDGGADRSAIVSIVKRCGNLSEEEKGCALELLDIYLDDGEDEGYFFRTAMLSGVPAGFICYGATPLAEGVFDIYWIVVDPDYRKKGVATNLLKDTEKRLAREGARLMMAETSGQSGYSPARSFYERNGFQEEARIRGFYKPGDDLVVYVKRV